MSKPKKVSKIKKGFKHIPGGNCWEGIQSPAEEDVCGLHQVMSGYRTKNPARGDCPHCPRCPACDNMNLATALSTPDEPVRSLALVPAPTFEFWPTASKTDLLFACTYPFGRKLVRTPVGERTRFGSAFHEVMEQDLGGLKKWQPKAIAKKWDVDPDEVKARVVEAAPIVKKWLSGGNQWALNFTKAGLQLEQSVAYNPVTGESRLLPDGPGENHDYPGRRPGEIPGTVDVASVLMAPQGEPLKIILVLDHKSGWNVAADWQPKTPAESGQLRTLACALAALHGADQVIVAFFHAPAFGSPVVYEDMLMPADLAAHRKSLRAAMNNIGNGWLRPGEWCPHCPAFRSCPTQTTTLVEIKRGVGALTSERVGAIHQALSEYHKLDEWLKDEISRWVRQNGPGVRPDGREVDLIPRERTGLSQASIIRAYGPLAGRKLIEKLRKDGAIETKVNLELRAK